MFLFCDRLDRTLSTDSTVFGGSAPGTESFQENVIRGLKSINFHDIITSGEATRASDFSINWLCYEGILGSHRGLYKKVREKRCYCLP